MAQLSVVGLRVVREVARSGSFSAAAERLGYTQSAVSRQVALMERAAGSALFERHARGVRLTEAGGVVIRRAEVVLAELDRTRQELADLDVRPMGRLRVGAFSTALAALVPRALVAFAGQQPGVRVGLREGTSPRLLKWVAHSRLDLAVVTKQAPPPEGVSLTTLLEDPLFVAVPRGSPLAARASVSPSDLRGESWIVGSAEPGSTLLGAWGAPDRPDDIAYVASDWTAKLGLVAAGLGVTVVPGLALTLLPAALAAVRIDHPEARRAVSVAVRSEPPERTGLSSFSETLHDAAAALAVEARRRVRV